MTFSDTEADTIAQEQLDRLCREDHDLGELVAQLRRLRPDFSASQLRTMLTETTAKLRFEGKPCTPTVYCSYHRWSATSINEVLLALT